MASLLGPRVPKRRERQLKKTQRPPTLTLEGLMLDAPALQSQKVILACEVQVSCSWTRLGHNARSWAVQCCCMPHS